MKTIVREGENWHKEWVNGQAKEATMYIGAEPVNVRQRMADDLAALNEQVQQLTTDRNALAAQLTAAAERERHKEAECGRLERALGEDKIDLWYDLRNAEVHAETEYTRADQLQKERDQLQEANRIHLVTLTALSERMETLAAVEAERDELLTRLDDQNADGCGWKPVAENALRLVREAMPTFEGEWMSRGAKYAWAKRARAALGEAKTKPAANWGEDRPPYGTVT